MKHFLLFVLINLPFLAFSQFSATFDSSELPETWVGDRSSFTIINGVLTLQSQLSAGEKSKQVQLAHPYSISSSQKEWSFYVQLDTKPTNSNYIKIFPQSSDASTLNGFYIRIGHNKKGKQSSRYSYGFDNQSLGYLSMGIEDATYTLVQLVIRLTDNKLWTIYARDAYNEKKLRQILQFETAITPMENAFFGFQITHTSSGNKKFGIEDIVVRETFSSLPEEKDEEEDDDTTDEENNWSDCSLEEIESLNPYEYKFYFSEAVNVDDATFYIEGKGYDGLEEADRIKWQEKNPNIVIIHFAQSASSGEYYTLYWTRVKDSKGKSIKDGFATGLFEETEEDESDTHLEPYDIRIHEIMADPKGFKPETEYIELHNCLSHEIQLKGCKLLYGNKKWVPLDVVKIEAKGYVVLYKNGNEMNQDISSFALDEFPANLANAGKELTLFDAAERIIDQYTYPKASPGKSWEYDKEGWHLSTDPTGGTPGRANSPLQAEEEEEKPKPKPEPEPDLPLPPSEPDYLSPDPLDIIISEILPEPFTGGSEYIELFNRSEKDFSLKDVAISTRKSDGSLNTTYSLGEYPDKFKAGEYLLLTKSLEGVVDFYEMPTILHAHECKLPVLANGGASLVLYRKSDQQIIDEVHYSSNWHDSSVKEKKGVSLERIDLNGESQDPSNWTSAASASGYGTPGKENSQQNLNPSKGDPAANEDISLLRLQPSGEYVLNYLLPQPGYYAKGWIFDIRGRKLSTLIENESLGTSGTIRWNGLGSDGNRLPAGVYIQYIEMWNAEGKTIRRRAAFLVH